MAKKSKAASFDDFTEENLLAVDTEKETEKRSRGRGRKGRRGGTGRKESKT